MNKNKNFMQLKHFILRLYNIIKETYYLLFGIGLILCLFYIRLLPRVSRDLWDTMTSYQFLTTSVKIVFLILNIIIILRILNVLPKKSQLSINEKFTKIFQNISDYILGMLINLYEFLGYFIKLYGKKLFGYENLFYHCMRKTSKFILKQNKTVVYTLLLLLKLIPQSVFISAFAYDVLVTKQLYYTFNCLPILLIPLLEQFIIFALTHFYEINWDPINSFMQSRVTIDENNVSRTQYKFISEFQDKTPKEFASFKDYFYNHYKVLDNLFAFIEEYKFWKREKAYYYIIQLFFCILRLFLLFVMLFYSII